MNKSILHAVLQGLVAVALVTCLPVSRSAQTKDYFPPAGTWAKKAPADLGMDASMLEAAIKFAQANEPRRAMDFSDQERTFGSLLGSVPTQRAHTNGVVIYKG